MFWWISDWGGINCRVSTSLVSRFYFVWLCNCVPLFTGPEEMFFSGIRLESSASCRSVWVLLHSRAFVSFWRWRWITVCVHQRLIAYQFNVYFFKTQSFFLVDYDFLGNIFNFSTIRTLFLIRYFNLLSITTFSFGSIRILFLIL